MKRKIAEIISQMTLEEKASICSGLDAWRTKPVPRLGIPSIMVSDGPHGLRKQDDSGDNSNDSIPAVCFPTACAYSCSFDRDLLHEMGKAIGDECQAEDVAIVLGPAVNIKRSPLCGRNFEYVSEDPYIAGELAASFINGVQSKNIGTSIKHFAANNQEFRRLTVSSEVSERALREIYLPAFETAVKQSQPATFMCSYNKINGVFASENKRLLTEILRNEWGFEGFVMSDWGAVNDRIKGLEAGLDLEMPSSGGITDAQIVKAVKEGILDEKILDHSASLLLKFIFKFHDNRQKGSFNKEKHHALAVKIEEESIVLLKNDGILPLSPHVKAAFIGGFAEKPRFQGGGSSHINAYKTTSFLSAAADFALEQSIKGKPVVFSYAKGFDATTGEGSEDLTREALELAQKSDVVVVFAGLPDTWECEGYDRNHLRLPESQNSLISALAKVNSNIVVVLHNGSPVEMHWVNEVKGIVESYLGGQGVGQAVFNILYGKVNPSGKLAETFPLRLEDTPSFLSFPGDGKKTVYSEDIFVGYRYYDARKMKVLFPFGHGLSYTTFSYSNLTLDKEQISDKDEIIVSLQVKNTGLVSGKEIVQVYVRDKTSSVQRPEKELKNFCKVYLQSGEEKTVTMTLDKRSFAYYSEELGEWHAAGGTYEILIGKSSRDIVLSKEITFKTHIKLPITITPNTNVSDILKYDGISELLEPVRNRYNAMQGTSERAKEAITKEMVDSMYNDTPLRSLQGLLGNDFTSFDDFLEQIRQICC